MVRQEGFPIAYDVFAGNTFEGHTLLPVIQSFIKKNKVQHFTVVADAAMISAANVNALSSASIHYIVGARLANVSAELVSAIDKNLIREDGKTIRLKTDNGFLICSFSAKRYKKDKHEMDKQIEKVKPLSRTLQNRTGF
jgi:transposase